MGIVETATSTNIVIRLKRMARITLIVKLEVQIARRMRSLVFIINRLHRLKQRLSLTLFHSEQPSREMRPKVRGIALLNFEDTPGSFSQCGIALPIF